jgi:aspartyl-tRNA(Asn)/glutamyl-tRNA(Gln) amidotransferase subunit A
MNEIVARSALQLSAMLAAGLVDAEELAERTLAAVAACDDQAVFSCVTAERAMREARAASARIREGRPRGLLDGVPVAWKDLFDIAGLTTTAGSRVLAGAPPARHDAPVVARLEAAGMVCVGRVNMTEFAYSGIGLNPHFGTPRNPNGAQDRVPGGSSSGSGVAVARGLVPVSIGSDTGGSVRIPAAFNGIIGYKSSTGRYPTEGAFPLSTTLDTVGVLCRTVSDAIIVDAALCKRAAPAARRRSLAGQRLIVPGNVVFDDAEPAVIANFEAALGRLAAAGAVVERATLPALDEILALMARRGGIAQAEAYALHRDRIAGPEVELMDRRVVARVRAAATIAMADYVVVLQERRRIIAEFAGTFTGGAVIAYPTVAHVAPSIAALEADDDLFSRINMRTLRNTNIGNFLDWCGVTIPSGVDASGMPTALLLSGAHGSDDDLLSLALSAEGLVRDAT